MRMPLVLTRVLQARGQAEEMSFPDGKLNFAWSYLRWQRNARFGRIQNHDGPERLTVIILNYRRPQNVAPIVRSLLRCSFVSRIIVCNNDPSYPMRTWLGCADERLEIVDEPMNMGCVRRFEVARERPGDYFLALDDDVFLWPWQVKRLFTYLVQDPDVPHGLFGEYILLDYQLRGEIKYQDVSVDILSRVYAFTRQHVDMFWRLVAELGLDGDFGLPYDGEYTPQVREQIGATNFRSYGDDIILSFSGKGRPVIHNIGRILCCPTGITPGVAAWKQSGFLSYRTTLVRRLVALRPDRGGATSRLAPQPVRASNRSSASPVAFSAF